MRVNKIIRRGNSPDLCYNIHVQEKRTKIICTLGPASSSVTVLTRMVQAGMNMARLNFSHGTHKEHQTLIRHVRQASRRSGKRVAILQDLQGPKIRVGELPNSGISLRNGQQAVFTTEKIRYESNGPIPVTYSLLHKDIKKGDRLLLDDGLIETVCEGVRGKYIKVKVLVGGELTSHKGMNLPDTHISLSAFTPKDHEDLLFGLEQEVDWVALSFVTSAKEVLAVRKVILAKCRALKTIPPKIMVKIERKKAVEGFTEILDVADGVMLARGDLGVEIPFEEVPIIQKEFIEICRQAGKPIVVATHMMDSMTENRRATRAEVSDVANAVIDHTDAVMLSQETAIGAYPVVAVQSMALIIRETEESRLDDISFLQLYDLPDIETSVAQSLHIMAENDQIDYIVTANSYDDIANKMNIFRPNVTIIVACTNESIARQMMVRAGIYPIVLDDAPATFIHRAQAMLTRMKTIKKQHRVAYVVTTPSGEIQLIIR